ncbi:hypothetical protein M422DRAFT_98755, partial [Sphaerobolus stellatus SS14]
ASPAAPGLFLCFATMVLLIFVSSVSLTWERISFLNVNQGSQTIHFGVFGYTGTAKHIGYFFDSTRLGLPGVNDCKNTSLNNDVIHSLTFVLILHPIATGFAGLAVLFGLCGTAYSRIGTIFMTLTATLGLLVALIAWVIARSHFRDVGASAQYGNANWLALGALIALILAFCAGAIRSCGNYRRRRAAA